jgi:L-seryl-tRNA(Ser) seleniumtransferase
MQNPLRNLPSVNELLDHPQLKKLKDSASHNTVVSGVRTFLDNLRGEIKSATSDVHLPSSSELADRIARWIRQEDEDSLRPVINATGILLHTGLGRAPLAKEAVDAMSEVAAGYGSVEVDLYSGNRSQRVRAVESLLREMTGAEAAAVVNNNAAATLLTLTTLGVGKEIIVSRGQLIEIGGSYRLPDVMTASGALLREVGTTNKTRIGDFASAINQETAALMRVHTSNYVVVGFTEEPTLDELVALGRKRNLPVIDDIGSGALIDFSKYGVAGEPIASESVAAGADLVLFSGDKLLGGPQCGIIVGRRQWIEKILKHPLMRAMRVDKLTLSALAATLRLYRDPSKAENSIPLLSFLSTSTDNLKLRAERLAAQLASAEVISEASAVEDMAMLGGGSMPTQQISTWCVSLRPAKGNVDQLARRLRSGEPSVFGRVQKDKLLLDLRTTFPGQDLDIVMAVNRISKSSEDSCDSNSVAAEANTDAE